MDIFLSLAIGLLAGLFLSRLAKKLDLPAVTAYLVAGVLIGPFVLGQLTRFGGVFTELNHLVSVSGVDRMSILSDVALGFIAFSIGNEFRVESLKKIGKQATVVGIFQALFTTLLVDAVLILLHILFPDAISLPTAIMLGAIAAATAPATTIMVIKQYKAKGALTAMLLPIVALDDAVGLILFSVSIGISKGLISGQVDLVSILVNPLLEILCSLLLGFVLGLFFTFSEKFFHSRSKRLAISVAFVFLAAGLSTIQISLGAVTISFSALLTCMMMGTVFSNVCDFSEELMDRLERWTAPLYVLFFVFSGASLDLSVFRDPMIILVGVVYVIVRCVGKFFGVLMSAKWMHCEKPVQDNLGLAMFPQGGVALGMAVTVAAVLGETGMVIRMITLFGVLIYELFSPSISKLALLRAGDIQRDKATSHRGVMPGETPKPQYK